MATSSRDASSRREEHGRPRAPGRRRAPEGPAKKTHRQEEPASAAPRKRQRPGTARRGPSGCAAAEVAAEAARQLLELTGKEAEGVTGLERTDDGWTVQVEVLEVRRIPTPPTCWRSTRSTSTSDGDLRATDGCAATSAASPGED